MKILGYVNRSSRGVAKVNNGLVENGNGEALFNLDLLTVFEVVVRLPKGFNVSSALYNRIIAEVFMVMAIKTKNK